MTGCSWGPAPRWASWGSLLALSGPGCDLQVGVEPSAHGREAWGVLSPRLGLSQRPQPGVRKETQCKQLTNGEGAPLKDRQPQEHTEAACPRGSHVSGPLVRTNHVMRAGLCCPSAGPSGVPVVPRGCFPVEGGRDDRTAPVHPGTPVP